MAGDRTSVLTFVIADIRGYTSFTQQHGDEAAARLAARFALIVREGVEAAGGDVIELRGDEALSVFVSPRDGLRAATSLQQVFADEIGIDPSLPLRVGIGLDVGEAVPVAGGYRGGALNLAARLCSQARPGEILASEGVTHLARAVEGLGYDAAGRLELKGLAEPVGVVRVTADGLDIVALMEAAADGRAKAAAAAPSRLPAQLDPVTPIIGRERELRRLGWAWRQARRGNGEAVAITGPSGIGKTRVAAAAAEQPAAEGAAVVYVDLAGDHETALTDATAAAESGRPCLIVVDDVDSGPAAGVKAAIALAERAAGTHALVVVAFDDERADLELLAGVRRATGDSSIRLPPLDLEEARRIAALYLGDDSASVPADLLEEAGGVPGLIHLEVGRWAHALASRRLGTLASQAAAGRTGLRTIEDGLASSVVDLQTVRERARLYGGAGRRLGDGAESPYKGLASFDAGDADWFFGRERLTADLIARLAGSTLLGVVGPSGSGKSSAVRAGLVPALERGVLPSSESWTTVVVRPGRHPLRELDRALWACLPDGLREQLGGEDLPLRAARDRLAADGRIVLVIDQFEEVFTICEDPVERGAFVDALTEAALDPRANESVVVTVRADYYGRCAEHPALAELLGRNHVLVGPMSAEDYRRAIEQPALQAGVRVEPALSAQLVSEAVGEPGALPLLSTALLELWEHRNERMMTAEAHAHTGGISGAVGRLAEETYAGLGPDREPIARAVMLRLAGAGEGSTVVRRRVPLAEFDLDGSPDVRAVLDVLTARRLLTVSEGTVEVSHEALLREWPRFREWLDEDREGRRLHAHLAVSASEWSERSRDPAELYRGARLSSALDWTTAHTLELNQLERDFVTASREESQRDELGQRRRNRRLRILLAGTAALLVAALVAGATALVQRAHARRSATSALAQSLGAEAVSEPQLDRALLLAVEGVKLSDSPLTRADLVATLLRSPRMVATYYTPSGVRPGSVAVSPDGSQLAIGEYGNSVFTYSTATRRKLVSPPLGKDEFVIAVAYTPDSRRLLVLTLNGLHMFPAGTAGAGHTLPLPKGYDDSLCTRCLAVTPDGRYAVTVASGRHGSALIRWDMANGTAATTAFSGPAAPMLVSPDGGTVLLEGDNSRDIQLWDTARMRATGDATLPAGASPTAITNGGRTIALSLPSGAIAFMDSHSQRTSKALAGGPTDTIGAAFTPDGDLYVNGGGGGSVAIWDVPSRTLVDTDTGHSSSVQGISIPADGSTVYTTSLDGSVIAYDLSTRHGLAQPFGNTGLTYGGPWFSVRKDATQVALPLQDGRVQLLSGQALTDSRFFYGFPDHRPAGGMVYSPQGTTLAVGAGAPAGGGPLPGATLWSLSRASPRYLGQLTGLPKAPNSTITAFSFTSDGTRLVATDAYGSQYQYGAIGIFDARNGRPIGRVVKLQGSPYGLGLNPDSSRVAVGLTNGRLEVLSLPDLHELAVPLVDRNLTGRPGVTSVMYSPAGTTIAVGDAAGTVNLVDATSYHPLQTWLPLVGGFVLSVSFNGDGSLLSVSGTDGSTHLVDVAAWRPVVSPIPSTPDQWVTSQFTGDRLFVFSQSGAGDVWPLSLEALTARACAVAHRNMSIAEWREFLPGRAYQKECPAA